MARLAPDILDPAEMHLSPVEVAELIARLPADDELVTAVRAGLDVGEAQREAAQLGPRWGQPSTRVDDTTSRPDERREAWARQADVDGPDSDAARRVGEIDAAAARRDAEPDDRQPVEPTRWVYPDGREVDATQKCLEWAREWEADREAADEDRRRFADSEIDYGDDDEDVDDDADVA